jgi:hypothetical protein
LAIEKEIGKNRGTDEFSLRARLTAESLGTAFLVAAVVGDIGFWRSENNRSELTSRV